MIVRSDLDRFDHKWVHPVGDRHIFAVNNYRAKVVCDSLSSNGVRLTTFEICMPKCLVAEFNTHRMLCRNSASSRAVPTTSIIREVMTNPVYPISWRAQNIGMEASIILPNSQARMRETRWLRARDAVVTYAKQMLELPGGLDKQVLNRMLEPWMWTVVIATATEWENFFVLRDSTHSQPEFGYIATLMYDAYVKNTPLVRDYHFPYASDMPFSEQEAMSLGVPDTGIMYSTTAKMLESAAHIGRVSYYRQGRKFTAQENIDRALAFIRDKHWSPTEQTAISGTEKWYGPLYGWKPLRYFFANQSGGSRQP